MSDDNQPTKVGDILINQESYGLHGNNMGELAGTPNNRMRHTLTVEFITDMVPGAYHDPIDLMEVIKRHSYVTAVRYDGAKPLEVSTE